MRGLIWVGWLTIALSGCRGPGALPELETLQAGGAGSLPSAPNEAAPDVEASAAGGAPAAVPAIADAAAGAPEAAGDCYAEPVTLEQIHAGRVRPGFPVSVAGLIATSQKFLLSEAKSGSCLWGAFVADPERGGAGSALLLVSFGAPRAEGAACQSGSDGLPDDLAAGDRLEVAGFLDEYAPAACPDVAPAWQLRVEAACPALRQGSTVVPEPVVIDTALADQLAAGRDRELLRAWGGALVRLEDVTARQDPEDLDAVFPFGVIELEQTALPVHTRLYYFDLSQGGPRAPAKAVTLSYPARFEQISGLLLLDYCTWALGPRDRCQDLSPPTDGCAAQVRRP